MKQFVSGLFALALVIGLSAQARADQFNITVDVDDTTAGDLSLIGDFLANASNGQAVSRSLRRIVMGAVGEMSLLVKARIDSEGYLTLDDGTGIALLGGDSICPNTIMSEPNSPGGSNVGICFQAFTTTSATAVTRPCAIFVDLGDGNVNAITIPPVGVMTGGLPSTNECGDSPGPFPN